MHRDAPSGPNRDIGSAIPSFHVVNPDGRPDLLLVCDHASNALPERYGTLGMAPEMFGRHIAYDIGAAALTEALARRLGAPAILAGFSRLLIDPNRGLDDPTLVMALSDGTVIPGNHPLTDAERRSRIETYYAPYHDAIASRLADAEAGGVAPAILSIHSFTAIWKHVPRPWQVGILWNRDARLAGPLLAALRAEGDLTVGDNEPYSGELAGDCMDRHGTQKGRAHALIEVRQDLIGDADSVARWSERLARVIQAALPEGAKSVPRANVKGALP